MNSETLRKIMVAGHRVAQMTTQRCPTCGGTGSVTGPPPGKKPHPLIPTT